MPVWANWQSRRPQKPWQTLETLVGSSPTIGTKTYGVIMHIITECPRCHKDFMYHTTDYHLKREEPISDQDLISEECRDDWETEITICQDCDEKEKLEKK